MIQVKVFFAYNELRNFSYLLNEDSTGDAWVIDPYDPIPISNYIKENGLRLQGIVNTHQHFDHIRGNTLLHEAFKSPVKKLYHLDKIGLHSGWSLDTFDTPGHTPDHQVFLLKSNNKIHALFSGDTLFNSGVGNCSGGGNVDQLFDSTATLLKIIPDDALLYPGHDYRKKNLEFSQTVEPQNVDIREALRQVESLEAENWMPVSFAEEKKVNPFLRLNSDEIQHVLNKDLKHLDEKYQKERELFRKLRQRRDHW